MNWSTALFLALATVPFGAVANCVNTADITGTSAYISKCLDPAVYDFDAPPPTDGPIHVEVQFNIRQLNQVDQRNGVVTIGGYFRQWWRDERLAFNSTFMKLIKFRSDELVWDPNIFADNLEEFENPSDGWSSTKLVDIQPDGSVFKSEMALLKLKCPFIFRRLPFDRQDCKIVVASYSKDVSKMRIYPRGGRAGAGTSGVAIVGNKIHSGVWNVMDGTDFEVPGVVVEQILEHVGTGVAWDYVELPFYFARFPDYYQNLVIFPCLLFLILSYIGFYLSPKAVPARALVAVIPLLILITLINQVYKSLPQSAEPMWLVTYLLAGLVFAIIAVVEFGCVQFLLEREAQRQKNLETLQAILPVVKKIRKKARSRGLKTLHLVDKISKEGLVALAASEEEEAPESANEVEPSSGGGAGGEVEPSSQGAPIEEVEPASHVAVIEDAAPSSAQDVVEISSQGKPSRSSKGASMGCWCFGGGSNGGATPAIKEAEPSSEAVAEAKAAEPSSETQEAKKAEAKEAQEAEAKEAAAKEAQAKEAEAKEAEAKDAEAKGAVDAEEKEAEAKEARADAEQVLAEVTTKEDAAPASGGGLQDIINHMLPTSTSEAEKAEHPKEVELLGLQYIASIFAKHDFDGSNCLSHKEVCTALSYFNIWLCWKTTATAMCMFLRDSGETTPDNEEEVTIEFGRFTEFLICINNYLLKANTTTNLWYQFLQQPPSILCDVVFRYLFPMSWLLVNIVMLAIR